MCVIHMVGTNQCSYKKERVMSALARIVAIGILLIGAVVSSEAASMGPLSDQDREDIKKNYERTTKRWDAAFQNVISEVRESGRERWGFGATFYFGRFVDVRGLVVAHVRLGSPAERAGLKEGDFVEWAVLVTDTGRHEVGIVAQRDATHQETAYGALEALEAGLPRAELDIVFVRPVLVGDHTELQRMLAHMSAVVIQKERIVEAEALAKSVENTAAPLQAALAHGANTMIGELANVRTWEEFLEREEILVRTPARALDRFWDATVQEANAFIAGKNK